MVSLPLDLSSVERRGQPTAVKEPIKKTSRIYELAEAPVYQPTEEEWKDPIEYMRKITPYAKDFGICKVIPPDSWNPDFAIDTEVSTAALPSLACSADHGTTLPLPLRQTVLVDLQWTSILDMWLTIDVEISLPH